MLTVGGGGCGDSIADLLNKNIGLVSCKVKRQLCSQTKKTLFQLILSLYFINVCLFFRKVHMNEHNAFQTLLKMVCSSLHFNRRKLNSGDTMSKQSSKGICSTCYSRAAKANFCKNHCDQMLGY